MGELYEGWGEGLTVDDVELCEFVGLIRRGYLEDCNVLRNYGRKYLCIVIE
jgi:hypothetical protein